MTVPDKSNAGFNIVVLPSAATVSGHLAVPAGMTLPPLRANLSEAKSQLTTETDVHTDGTFEIPNVPPGTYLLRIVPNLGIPPETITVTGQDRRDIVLGGKAAGIRVSGNVRPSDQTVFQNMFPQWLYLVGKDATEVSPARSIPFFTTNFTLNSDPSQPQPPPDCLRGRNWHRDRGAFRSSWAQRPI